MGQPTTSAPTLRQALRSSPWLVIAVGLHGALLAVFSVVYVVQQRVAAPADVEHIVFTPRVELDVDEAFPPPPRLAHETVIPRDVPHEITDTLDIWEPEPEAPIDLTAPVGEVGSTDLPPGLDGGNSNIGTGDKPGIRSSNSPKGVFTNRPGKGGGVGDKARELVGPPLLTEKAVREGLIWLGRHQQPDGSWSAATLSDECTSGRPCAPEGNDYSHQYDPGVTGLALLAFLGRGLTAENDAILVDEAFGKQMLTGDIVGAGLKWLVREQGPDGSFRNYPGLLYNEAIGALALSEAWGLSRSPAWKAPAEKAIRYLVSAQKANPFGSGRWGWRYTPGGDTIADTSVTGWVVMALKSAQLAGLDVPRDAFDGALDFVNWASTKEGFVGYLGPDAAGEPVTGHGDQFDYHVGTMSSLGMLVRTFAKHDIRDPFLEAAAQQIVKDLPSVSEDRLSVDYYYWYYGSLALNQFDGPDSPRPDRGKYWKPWNEAMIAALVSLQDGTTEKSVCSRGGWLAPDRWCYAGGPVYATAMNVLTLEVYYRYENAFGVVAKAEGR